MRRDLALIAVDAAVASAVAYTSAPGYLKAAVALPLLFFSPGYVWSAALLPGRTGGQGGRPAERAAISVGLSLALLVLGGLLIAALRLEVERASWLWLLEILVTVGIGVDLIRNGRAARAKVVHLQLTRPRRGWVLSGVAALLAVAAVTTAVVGARTAPTTRFTSLSFGMGAGGWGIIVVHNSEGTSRRYLLVITDPDGTTRRIPLTLASDATWQRSIALEAGTEADLYVVDSSGRPGGLYRSVSLRS